MPGPVKRIGSGQLCYLVACKVACVFGGIRGSLGCDRPQRPLVLIVHLGGMNPELVKWNMLQFSCIVYVVIQAASRQVKGGACRPHACAVL